MPGDVKEKAPAWAHAVAGQIAGMVGLMVVHPIDTVKIRMQARVSAPPVSAVSTVSSLMQREGPMALYRGIGAPMVAYGLINAVAFTTHTEVVRLLRGELGGSGGSPLVKDPYLIGLAGGAAAGFTSSFVRGPAERVKTVQQVAESSCGTGKVPEKYRGTIRTAATLAKEHGLLKGWFTGTGATVAREIPQCAVYFLTYDSIRRACEKAAGPGYETAGIVLAGGSAGVVQWVATYPLDVIKSRMQAFPPGTYNGFLDCAMKSLRAEGPGVFVRGLEMALLRAFPLHASIFLTCETIHGMLAKYREEQEAERRWEQTGKL